MNMSVIAAALFIGIGILTIVAGLLAKQFRPVAMGKGDRSATLPRWFGRIWAVGVGLTFLYVGWKGSLPKMVGTSFATILGVGLIISNIVVLVRSETKSKASSIWAFVAGVLLIAGALLYRSNH